MPDIDFMAPESGKGIWFGADFGPLVDVRLSVDRSIWRLGPAWAVVAGALASGLPLTTTMPVFRLVAAVVLADSAWGLLWRVAAAPPRRGGAEAPSHRAMPYAWPGSPLARTVQYLRGMETGPGSAFHWLAGGLSLTLALSLLLGAGALALSLVAAGIALAAWVRLQQNSRPAFCFAILNLGLPWVLGMYLAQIGSGMLVAHAQPGVLVVAGGFFLLQWGILRGHSPGRRRFVLWVGQLVTLLAPIALKLPIGAAALAVLSAPPLVAQLAPRSRATTEDGNARDLAAISWSAPWWWASMLVAALAVRLAA